MPTLYAQADFSYPVGRRLRQLGHDMLTAPEAGQACGEVSAQRRSSARSPATTRCGCTAWREGAWGTRRLTSLSTFTLTGYRRTRRTTARYLWAEGGKEGDRSGSPQ